MTSSLYVHIPFCKTICTYCDFCKIYYDKKLVDHYLEVLEEELYSIYQGEEMKTIYIGGGTPSCLSTQQLKKLFDILGRVKKSKNIEYTIECNFDSTTNEKIDLFYATGINRLSFGVETTHPSLEVELGRKNNKSDIHHILSYAREKGIQNMNLDLMYALRNETLDDLKADLEFLQSLNVPHISTYSLMIEKNTILGIREEKNIDPDMELEMYEMICKFLKEHGYYHYEISNFAKKGYESRHNLVYWKNECYYGIGLGAASYYNNKRLLNTRSMNHYLEGKRILEEEEVSEYDAMIYEVILSLRLTSGISLSHFKKKFQKNLSEVFPYQNLLDQGLLQKEDNFIKISEEKLYISNYIIEEFIYGKK